MPDASLTELAIVLDRSGSMQSIKDDMEGGLWSTVIEQHGVPGRCRVSLYQFDDVWEAVFEGKLSGEVQPADCRLVPRGATALNDAVVKSLAALEARVMGEDEANRPAIVLVVVITDGQENASKENSVEDVRRAIGRATDKFGWQFLFLAADAAGFQEGRAMTAGTKGKRLLFEKSRSKEMHATYAAAASRLRRGEVSELDIGEGDDDEGPKEVNE